MISEPYNFSPFLYKRKKTREVKIGNVKIGSNHSIKIQSMTTTSTRDTSSTVNQILALERAGCEMVRLTVPSRVDADNLVNIKKQLKKENSQVPLVADIHFTPAVAMRVVDFIDKVRINPGNFTDKKKFLVREYTDKEYELELEKIYDIFSPLVLKCKKNQIPIRIGTNHGSLSDRIMNRYGDTSLGMVESALEFIKIAESHSFFDIVISMKSSNVKVMVQAYRLLVSRFIKLNMDYPLHLGVTEAGDGQEGKIKSSIGIGSLLEDGLGDTIRVSLTGDPLDEIPVARAIAERYNKKQEINSEKKSYELSFNPYEYQKRKTITVSSQDVSIGGNSKILTEIIAEKQPTKENLQILESKAKEQYTELESILIKSDLSKSFFYDKNPVEKKFKFYKEQIYLHKLQKNEIIAHLKRNEKKIIELELESDLLETSEMEDFIRLLIQEKVKNVIFSLKTENTVYDYRKLSSILSPSKFPILISYESKDYKEKDFYSSVIGLGSLLVDGIGEMIRLKVCLNQLENLQILFNILQATRARISKTEYISCPSCGRTLFELKETTEEIKKRTSHLKGLKIAIMGCIVNGPGEMADADFGYVGAGPGKVHLYKGKEIMLRAVPSEIAADKLEELIKQSDMWQSPQ